MKLKVAGKERGLKATSGQGLVAWEIEANKILPARTGREARACASTELCSLPSKCNGPHCAKC